MSEIVRELSQLGWDDHKIGKELGMDSDEVLRLKQINGLQELFADRQYSRAGLSNNYSWRRRSAAASNVDSFLAKQRRISLWGRIGAKHRQRNRRYTVLPRQPLAKLNVIQRRNRAVIHQQKVSAFAR